MSATRLEATVHGVVQGVGFRAFVRSTAARMGLSGFVKNRMDGTVAVVAEGERDSLDRFLDALERGPSGSVVEKVERAWKDPEGGFDGFSIRF